MVPSVHTANSSPDGCISHDSHDVVYRCIETSRPLSGATFDEHEGDRLREHVLVSVVAFSGGYRGGVMVGLCPGRSYWPSAR